MRRKLVKIGKKFIAFALAAAMVTQPATGIPFASAIVVSAEEANLVQNPTFVTGWVANDAGAASANWAFVKTGESAVTAESGKVTYVIKSIGESEDTHYMNNSGISLQKDHKYKISLNVKSSEARSVRFGFIVPTQVFETAELEADTEKTVSMEVTSEQDTSAAELRIRLGKIADGDPAGEHTVEISAVSIVDITEASPDPSEGSPGEGYEVKQLEVYNESNGPEVAYKDGLFSFCLPKVNGVAIAKDALDTVKTGYKIQIKKGEEWKNIDDADSGVEYKEAASAVNTWAYDYWSWDGGGSYGIMFNLVETSYIRFQSVANEDVHVDYTLTYPSEPVEPSDTTLEYTGDRIEIGADGKAYLAWATISVNGDKETGANQDNFAYTVKPAGAAEFQPAGEYFKWQMEGERSWWYNENGRAFSSLNESFTLRIALNDKHVDIEFYIDTTVDEKGPEYDFSKGSAEDVADPGMEKAGYELVWHDEFDGNYADGANVDRTTGLNLDNWAYQLGDGSEVNVQGWGNDELQAYSNRTENIGVNEDLDNDGEGEGVLRITAKYEEDGYKAEGHDSEPAKKYSSGRIRTTENNGNALFTTTYGYIEARMSLPATKGAWPAFWMLPQSTDIYGAWPVSGEIDIMETCGAFDEMGNDVACGTLHWGVPEHVYKGSGYYQMASNYNNFHTYAVDWEPGKMTWYYDGVPIHALQNWESKISGASDSLSYDAPFDTPYYILLNLAVDSGQFGGAANKATFQDEINMYVDYVRAYQKSEGYPDSVERTASDEVKDDWDEYAGINQIAEIKENNLEQAWTPDASADSAKWYLCTNASSSGAEAELAPYTDADGKTWAKLDISAAGNQEHAVQMIGHYDAKKGYLYRVSFDTYAEGDMVGQTVNADSKEWMNWSANGIQSYALGNTAQTISFTFEQKTDFDKCRIEFNLGAKKTGTVYISNVKVEIIDPQELGTSDGSGRQPLLNGDVIYNGTFDQGSAHVGGWNAVEGTMLTVPRYTTEKITDNDVNVVDVASTLNDFEALENGGVKYYERRAQISAEAGTVPKVYQPGIALLSDSYTMKFDMYSEAATTVQAAIYSVNDEGKLGTKLLESPVVDYSEANAVKQYKWTFATPRSLKNAALVFSFGEGASVQIDNVTMIGASQSEPVDTAPVDSESTWSANAGEPDENASIIAEEVVDGVHKFTVTSGKNKETGEAGSWYSPQITSSQFKTVSGKKYKVSADLKLEGKQNGTVSYIIQNQGGSWEVIQSVVDIDLSALGSTDEDGFYHYEAIVDCDSAYSNVALNFGLGKSGAEDATFCFKNVTMTLVEDEENPSDDPSESMGETQTGIAIDYVLGAEDAQNADANPFYYTKGEGTITLAEPTREGYLFAGWTLEENSEDYITSVSTDADAITVYAHWILRVDAATPVIENTLEDTECEVGDAVTLTVTATREDDGTLSYQWYRSPRRGTSKAVAIDGENRASYTPDTATPGTTYYYCVVTNTNTGEEINGSQTATAASNIAAVVVVSPVEVEKPRITKQPVGATYTEGETATALTVEATVGEGTAGEGTLSYQWYQNTENSAEGATPLAGETRTSCIPSTATVGTTYYFCKVTNTKGNKTASQDSVIVEIKVNAAATTVNAETPKITTQPVSKTYTAGATATALTVVATVSDGGTLSYQWYRNTANNTTTGTVIPGATSAAYTPVVSTAGTTYYYCVVTNTNDKVNGTNTATATTNAAAIVVNPVTSPTKYTVTFDSNGGTSVAAQTVESGKTATMPTAPTRSGYTFAGWYNGTTAYDFKTPVTSNLTLTAKWTANNQGGNNQGGNNQGGNNQQGTDQVKVNKIKITGMSKSIAAGKKITLKADVTPANAANKELTWKSSNTKYATVNSKGVVTTKKAGVGKSVTITATAKDGSNKKATYKITLVNKAVKKVKLTAKTKTVKAGKKLTVKPTVTLSGKIDKKSKSTKANKTLAWKSSNTKYATVSSKGVVKANKAGKGKTVTITATATDGSGKKATIKIKISK